ncbi:class I SAM-dependent methyltransferase [Algoriphagus taiwanensis]|uniref:Class I SAM-dependent methyltransferase n=2 Tax=Algoriphagus taiwanensis TaxID=1445656 RepID=A0ABQ6PZ01_9BACT|nr:class I SAM-dependent methyltransferase [Algoriphagus taiwanensis]
MFSQAKTEIHLPSYQLMKTSIGYFSLLFFLCFALSCSGQSSSKKSKEEVYTYKNASFDGIGKVYMGREISFVMGFEGMSWLERSSREKEENVSKAIENLPVEPNSVVADIGAGSGYFTFRIAPRVPEGKVYAVEIQDSAIKYLSSKSKELGFSQVEPIMGTETSPNLPENTVDVALMVDVYHELEYPVEMLAGIRKALKPKGKLILIEYRGEDDWIPIKPLHKMTVNQAKIELEANGFKLVQNGKFLSIQHFLVFEQVAKPL